MDVLLALALIGLALFVGAILLRRAPTGLLVFGAVAVGFGLGIPALVIDDNTESKSEAGTAATGEAATGESAGGDQQTEEASAKPDEGGGGGAAGAAAEGKQIFTQSCGTCHTLADAGTNGTVGPNLDQLKPDDKRVASAIENGGAGTGAMPANIVSGKEAEAVATYISSVAGK